MGNNSIKEAYIEVSALRNQLADVALGSPKWKKLRRELALALANLRGLTKDVRVR